MGNRVMGNRVIRIGLMQPAIFFVGEAKKGVDFLFPLLPLL